MAVACAYAVALLGVEGHVVEVEADLALGLPGLTVTGLPDAALAQARDRVRAAVVNSGQAWPQRRITLGLSPAWLPKKGVRLRPRPGSRGALAAAGVVPADCARRPGAAGRARPGRLAAAGPRRAPRRADRGAARLRAGRRAGGEPRRGRAGPRRAGDRRALPARRSSTLLRGEPVDRAAGAPGGAGRGGAAAGPRRRRRAGRRADRGRGRRGGRPPPAPARPAGLRQDHAGRAAARAAAAAVARRGAGGDGDPLGRGRAPGRAAAGRPRRRSRTRTTPRPWRPSSAAAAASPARGRRRLAHHGVLFLDEAPEFSARRAGRAAAAAGVRPPDAAPGRGHGGLPGAVHLVLAANPCPCAAARLRPAPARRTPGAATWPGCRGRCSTGSTCTSPSRGSPAPSCWPSAGVGRAQRRRRRARAPGPGAGRRPLRRDAVAHQRRGAGACSCCGAGRCRDGDARAPSRRSTPACSRPAATGGWPGSPGLWPTSADRAAPGEGEVALALGYRLGAATSLRRGRA